MKIVVSDIQSPAEALTALGLRSMLGGIVEFPNGLGGGIIMPEASAVLGQAPAVPEAAGYQAPKHRAVKTIPAKHHAAAAKKSSAAPSSSEGRTPTQRDAIRAALNAGPKTTDQVVGIVQKSFPGAIRNSIATQLLKLSKAGQCELGDDMYWRAKAA